MIPVGHGDEHWRGLLPCLAPLAVREIVMVFAVDELHAKRQLQVADPRVHLAFAPRGRAQQLNAGAAQTQARWIWFVHADSVPTERTLAALAQFIDVADERDLGYFDLRFLGDGPALMAINRGGAWIRSRWLGLPFGDQGYVVSRRLFERLQGFDASLPCGEDHEFIWRARACGARIRAVGAPLYTSARKYAAQGWLRTTVAHLHGTWTQVRDFSRRVQT
ncbi:MAG: glycosyltransferase [Proteobacteria bacterium]|nr:glycosyltransferase [Pseudomonadota bacterium]